MISENQKETSSFFDLLTEGEDFTFLTLDDKGQDKSLISERHGSLEDHYEHLWNSNQQGAGIFCTVNRCDGKGRKKENVISVRALFIDLDGAPLQPVYEGLEPHIVVNTSPDRYHAYWLVDDVELDEFTPLQKALIKKFNSDPHVHDLSRVMRLPGFYHHKKEPFLTRMVTI